MKRNKTLKGFHEFLISFVYTLVSFLLCRPSSPVAIGQIAANEGIAMRSKLHGLGIPTPELLDTAADSIVEEYVEGGDLYRVLLESGPPSLAYQAGMLTGKLHRGGYVFVDNKVQNYLVKDDKCVVRTDLGFTQRTASPFSRSMDVGSFLASVMDLPQYPEIEEAFQNGYFAETGRKFPLTSIIVRNLLSLGFSSDGRTMLQNMMKDSRRMLEI